MKGPRNKRYFLYARKSTESEDRQVLSIDSQIDELRRIASREGIEIVEILRESGSAKALGRTVFNEMIERIVKGEASGILCWKLDRLARNFIDGGKIIEMIQQGVIAHIRSFERSYYPQDNVLMMSLEFGTANQYSRDLSVNVTRGMRHKAEMGWYPTQPPLGYLNSINKGKGKNDVYDDPDRYALVRKCWDLMLTGAYNPQRILKIATEEWGLRTRKGKKMSPSMIYCLFTNPFYMRIFEFPRGSGNWYEGKHGQMVTPEEYDRVQRLLGKKGRTRPKTHSFDFTGMMRCGECGRMITAEEKWKRQKNGNVHHYVYYHCTKRNNPQCTQPTLRREQLEEQITSAIESISIPPEFHAYALKWFRKQNEQETAINTTILASQQKAYDTCIRKIGNLIDMRAGDEITEQEFSERKDPLLREKARLYELLSDTDGRVNKQVEKAEELFAFAFNAIEKFNSGPLQIRKQILAALGSNLILKDKILSINWRECLLPEQKLAGEVSQIHERLEPPKKEATQEYFDEIYAGNPVVSPQMESNHHRPLKRRMLYH